MTLWTHSSFAEIKQIKDDGLVCLGCGGDLQEWVDGVTAELKQAGIVAIDFQFESAYRLETTGGRIDLVLIFKFDQVDMSRLPLWRLQFGDCSWLSDYVVNYADHF